MARRRQRRPRLWIQRAIKRPGALREKARRAGALRNNISVAWLRKQAKKGGRTGRQARLALTLRKFTRRRRR